MFSCHKDVTNFELKCFHQQADITAWPVKHCGRNNQWITIILALRVVRQSEGLDQDVVRDGGGVPIKDKLIPIDKGHEIASLAQVGCLNYIFDDAKAKNDSCRLELG